MMGDWQPIETAPFQTVIEVRNPQMEKPVRATRGYTHNGMVHPDNTFCTTVFTPDKFFPFPAGKLCRPTEWRALDEQTAAMTPREVSRLRKDAALSNNPGGSGG